MYIILEIFKFCIKNSTHKCFLCVIFIDFALLTKFTKISTTEYKWDLDHHINPSNGNSKVGERVALKIVKSQKKMSFR